MALLAQGLPAEPGSALPAPGVLRLFLGHAIKWAPAVAHFRAGTATATTAADFVAAFRATIAFASGRRWPLVFKAIAE